MGLFLWMVDALLQRIDGIFVVRWRRAVRGGLRERGEKGERWERKSGVDWSVKYPEISIGGGTYLISTCVYGQFFSFLNQLRSLPATVIARVMSALWIGRMSINNLA